MHFFSPVWSPHLKKDIAALEIVQRRAFRFALGTKADRMSYEDRLKRLKWLTLEKRRTFSSLTECYKTVNGLNGISPLDFLNFADKYRTLRSNHRCELKTIPAKVNCYKHSFFYTHRKLMEQFKRGKETASKRLKIFEK